MYYILRDLPIIMICFDLWDSSLTQRRGLVNCGKTSATHDLCPSLATPWKNAGNLKKKHIEPSYHSHQELNPFCSNASRSTSTSGDNDTAFIRRLNLSCCPYLQFYFLSNLHQKTLQFSPLSLHHNAKRPPPIQTSKYILSRQLHHLNSPTLNTYNNISLSKNSTKPLIIPFHMIISTYVSSYFSA